MPMGEKAHVITNMALKKLIGRSLNEVKTVAPTVLLPINCSRNPAVAPRSSFQRMASETDRLTMAANMIGKTVASCRSHGISSLF